MDVSGLMQWIKIRVTFFDSKDIQPRSANVKVNRESQFEADELNTVHWPVHEREVVSYS